MHSLFLSLFTVILWYQLWYQSCYMFLQVSSTWLIDSHPPTETPHHFSLFLTRFPITTSCGSLDTCVFLTHVLTIHTNFNPELYHVFSLDMLLLKRATNVFIWKLIEFLFQSMSLLMNLHFLFDLVSQHSSDFQPDSAQVSLWLPVLSPSQTMTCTNPSQQAHIASLLSTHSNSLIHPNSSFSPTGPTQPVTPTTSAQLTATISSQHPSPTAHPVTSTRPAISLPAPKSQSMSTHQMVTRNKDQTQKPKVFPNHKAFLTQPNTTSEPKTFAQVRILNGTKPCPKKFMRFISTKLGPLCLLYPSKMESVAM